MPGVKDRETREQVGGSCALKRAIQKILEVMELFRMLAIVVDRQTYPCDKLAWN